ncbi:hypothetical protein BpHYR1_048781, partial [Brachionus plicatilis]
MASRNYRDFCYHNYLKCKNESYLNEYREARRDFKKLNRNKMKSFFESKSSKDLKNSKKFWSFFKSSIKTRGEADFNSIPEELVWADTKASNPVDQVEMFNSCFASISSSSLSGDDDSNKNKMLLLIH